MRGCITFLMLLAVAAGCAYSIWQINLLRKEVAELKALVLADERIARDSMLEHARAAAEALGRGEIDVAQRELDRLSELIDQSRTVAADERDRLRRRLDAARKALSEGSASAGDFLRDLARDLSPSSRENPQEDQPPTAKP